MAHRVLCYLLAGVVAMAGAQAETRRRLSHQGGVIDAITGKSVGQVIATAYGSNKRLEVGNCPKYDDFLDDDVSRQDGVFAVAIPDDRSSYVVTYCKSGYASFTKLANDNQKDGTRVQPAPVRLFPRTPSRPQMFAAIQRLSADTRAAATTLSELDSVTYRRQLHALSVPERDLMATMVSASGPPPPFTDPANVPDVQQLVANFTSALEYFHDTEPDVFKQEVEKFKPIATYARHTVLQSGIAIQITKPEADATITSDAARITGQIMLKEKDGATKKFSRHPLYELAERKLKLVVVRRSETSEEWETLQTLTPIILYDGSFSLVLPLRKDAKVQEIAVLLIPTAVIGPAKLPQTVRLSNLAFVASSTLRLRKSSPDF